jgi:hypothetical protein
MQRTAVAAAAVVVAAAAAYGGAGDGADDRFVVHEWGTFTSMHGADGAALEGLSREEEALPDFVYDRTRIRDCPLRAQGWKGLEVPAGRVTRKMETPVVYFHSAKPRRVRVRVDFVRGLLTQWYPVSDLLGPPEGAAGAAPLDVSAVERSFLQWDVDVLAKGAAAPSGVPAVAPDDPWQFAREVDASWLRTAPRTGEGRAGPVESERYLFYRGLGAFPLPLGVSAERGGRLRVRNAGEVAVPFAVGLEVRDGRARISDFGPVPVRGETVLAVAGTPEEAIPAAGMAKKLESLVWDVLRKHGLHDDEARAMVRTWSRSWFSSEGTRVIWVVPRATTDAILPIEITPRPDELVRVLVGRSEVIAPETEDEDYAALVDISGTSAEDAARGMARLERRGRFLEPHLRNVVASVQRRAAEGRPRADDGVVLRRALGWIEKLGAGAESVPAGAAPSAR